MHTPFLLNSQPFFILGGQVHNSSGYGPESMQAAWKALAALRCNTAEVPVYWEQVEPQEGNFSFAHLDEIIREARHRNIRLVLLWFATWKNGSMQYVPEWVKSASARFPRVQTAGGSEVWVLSSHFAATRAADQSAYCSLLAHLREFDGADQTVIGIQIENEPGILGSVRDYSSAAEKEYQAAIPAELGQKLTALVPGRLRSAWESAGARTTGPWSSVFGAMSAEAFTTWSIARYIDALAEAGKAVYALPMYVNVWLGENGWHLPGVSYPSGGPVTFVLDLWKFAAPHIDLIAPDIYIEPQTEYNQVCASYARADNPLFVPESGGFTSNALNLFEAICTYHTTGYAVFGVEGLLAADGSVRPESRMFVDSFHIVASFLPLITRYHATGKLRALIQREFQNEQILDLGEFTGMARFTSRETGSVSDYRHRGAEPTRGRGILVMPNPRELYLAGDGFRLLLKEKRADERLYFTQANENFDGPLTHYQRVEEGHFTPAGDWVIDRMRNGDEITGGLWAAPDCGVVHAVLL
jgi:hypothetical protein